MRYFISLVFICLLVGCSSNKKSDAYGNFEAVEVIVSAEAAGKLLKFTVEEGITLDSGSVTGYIDTAQLILSRKQLDAQKAVINTKFNTIAAQIEVLNQQKETLLKDKARIETLFEGKAATRKQLDDIIGAVSVVEKQIIQAETQNTTVFSEMKSIDAQIAKINDQVAKSIIRNPMRGTVLNKYSEQSELVTIGKPLYKIADMETIILRVYVSGAQLPSVITGSKIKVLVDKNENDDRELSGIVSWVSSQAEFTPKIIQTKDERVNQVYAVKILVKNDGSLKIGMPGEVRFNKQN